MLAHVAIACQFLEISSMPTLLNAVTDRTHLVCWVQVAANVKPQHARPRPPPIRFSETQQVNSMIWLDLILMDDGV